MTTQKTKNNAKQVMSFESKFDKETIWRLQPLGMGRRMKKYMTLKANGFKQYLWVHPSENADINNSIFYI